MARAFLPPPITDDRALGGSTIERSLKFNSSVLVEIEQLLHGLVGLKEPKGLMITKQFLLVKMQLVLLLMMDYFLNQIVFIYLGIMMILGKT